MAALIRAAQADDLSALADLIERAYRGDAARIGWTHEADLLTGTRLAPGDLQARLDDDGTRMLVALADDTPIGAVEVARRSDGLAYLGLLTVEPTRQGGGVGRGLVSAAEEAARALGAVRLEMTVIARRVALIAWYERLGYRATGEVRPFDYPATFAAGVDRDDVAFTVLAKALT